MATFVMLGKYTSESIKKISADRTVEVGRIIKELGGEIRSMYALMGENDLIFIVDLPNVSRAIKASLEMNVNLGISIITYPALEIEEFDKFGRK
jgi:uncharacterized protein with GYD domain